MAVSIGTTAFSENRVDANEDFLLPVVTAAGPPPSLPPDVVIQHAAGKSAMVVESKVRHSHAIPQQPVSGVVALQSPTVWQAVVAHKAVFKSLKNWDRALADCSELAVVSSAVAAVVVANTYASVMDTANAPSRRLLALALSVTSKRRRAAETAVIDRLVYQPLPDQLTPNKPSAQASIAFHRVVSVGESPTIAVDNALAVA